MRRADGLPHRAVGGAGGVRADFVHQLLRTRRHNISRAARDAGIAREYLHRLMKKHRISSDEE
jgi:transcriptional regulator of acetoin/glycerol metabolism